MLILSIEAMTTRSPLKPVELHVLLGLSEAPLHGYALVERIAELSAGKLRLLPGNLYVVLHRLSARGLLREHGPGSVSANGEGGGARRRAYQLTARGQAALREELARLDLLLRSAPARTALAERSGGEKP
jgi:DNA-binding PadR family transcriptional regulator